MRKMRWAIAIQSKTVPWDTELSRAICSCLRQLGYSASLYQDGDPEGLEQDVLLMLNVLGNYPVYCRQLKLCKSKRPVTILWQMDPLPPENLPPESEKAGLKAARLRDRLWLRQPTDMPRWRKLLTLYRPRVWCYQKISSFGFRRAYRLMKQNLGGDYDWIQIRGVLENWQDILDSHNEGWIDHCIVSTDQRRRFLMNRGITAHFIPVGAHEYMGRYMGLRRDIPVGFLGYVKYGRRAKILEDMGKRLRERGIILTRNMKDFYGEQRCEWLNRTKIIINLHSYPWNPAWIRFLIAAKCRTLIVSEPMNDEHPMVAGIHYVAATLDEMPDVICALLDNPEEIDRITSSAATLCQDELTLINAVEKICRLGGKTKSEEII